MDIFQTLEQYYPVCAIEKKECETIRSLHAHFGDSLLHRKNEFAHFTSSSVILNKDLTKMLMIHHNIYNTWTWTGGHNDGNPNCLEVAITEATEETGIQRITPIPEIASVNILPVVAHMKNDVPIPTHLHLNISYVLLADESEPLILNERETSNVAWIDVEQLASYSNEPYLIALYQKHIAFAKIRKGNNSRFCDNSANL
ncbi:MAG: NUDIX hydrolase [Bacilli bacterium]